VFLFPYLSRDTGSFHFSTVVFADNGQVFYRVVERQGMLGVITLYEEINAFMVEYQERSSASS
jgi:hypothetical protein